MGAALRLVDLVWLSVFSFEFLAKIVALGFIRKPYSYCRRGAWQMKDSDSDSSGCQFECELDAFQGPWGYKQTPDFCKACLNSACLLLLHMHLIELVSCLMRCDVFSLLHSVSRVECA